MNETNNFSKKLDDAIKEIATIALKEVQRENPKRFKETFLEATHEKLNGIIRDISETGKELGYKVTIKYIVNVE